MGSVPIAAVGWGLAFGAVALLPVVWTWAFVLFTWAARVRYGVRKDRPLPSRSALAQVAVLWREVVALLHAQAWRATLPWASRHVRPPDAHGHPVLCVHGFTQDASNWRRVRIALHARGRSVDAVSMGYPPRPIDAYVRALEAGLDSLLATTPGPVDVVCHSMGGVILRFVIQARPDIAARLGRVVTVATPHLGTAAAVGVWLAETRLLRRQSPELRALPMLHVLAPRAVLVSIGSLDDATVYPEDSTRAGGVHHTLVGLGHAGLIADPEGVNAIVHALHEPATTPP